MNKGFVSLDYDTELRRKLADVLRHPRRLSSPEQAAVDRLTLLFRGLTVAESKQIESLYLVNPKAVQRETITAMLEPEEDIDRFIEQWHEENDGKETEHD